MTSFAVQKLVSLVLSHLFILFISSWEADLRKIIVPIMLEKVLPMLFSNFMVSCLMFKSLSHFESLINAQFLREAVHGEFSNLQFPFV